MQNKVRTLPIADPYPSQMYYANKTILRLSARAKRTEYLWCGTSVSFIFYASQA